MIDAATVALLHDIVRRESRSMLSYVGDAYPWTAAQGHHPQGRVQKIVAAGRDAVAALGRFLAKHKVPPGYIGSFPEGFTTINFLSFEYLVPKLIASEKQLVAELERDLPAVRHGDARHEVEKLLAVKRENLKHLEELAPLPKAAVS